jgi:hypothetical protein
MLSAFNPTDPQSVQQLVEEYKKQSVALNATNAQLQDAQLHIQSLTQQRAVERPVQASSSSSFHLKPIKPSPFTGRHGTLPSPATWLNEVKTYFNAVGGQDDKSKMNFIATCFKEAALTWWIDLLDRGLQPASWSEFETCFRARFIPFPVSQAARESLLRITQTRSA